MVIVAAAFAGLVGGLVLGLLIIKRSGTWCPKCGDPKRCPRGHKESRRPPTVDCER